MEGGVSARDIDRRAPASRLHAVTRSPARLAVAVVLLAVIGVCAGVIAIGLVLSAPVRAVIGVPPPDLGAEPVAIASGSGATLRGWFVAGRAGSGAVVLMHRVHHNRLTMVRRAQL